MGGRGGVIKISRRRTRLNFAADTERGYNLFVNLFDKLFVRSLCNFCDLNVTMDGKLYDTI